jgi:LysM repeat protein
MFPWAVIKLTCAILLKHKVKVFKMNKSKTKAALPFLVMLIAVILSSNFYLLPVWARSAEQEQQPSPTTGSNPFGLTLSTPAPDGSISHTVQEGEFLITIAEAYGITLDELLALNGLTADSIIQPGQVLLIRQATSPQPALTSGTVQVPTATLRPSLTPLPTLTPFITSTPTVTPTPGPGIFERIFTGPTRYVGFGFVALVFVGVILLVISARRMR